jgi:hypothetical protein
MSSSFVTNPPLRSAEWITDRVPTRIDADDDGDVRVWDTDTREWAFVPYEDVFLGDAWLPLVEKDPASPRYRAIEVTALIRHHLTSKEYSSLPALVSELLELVRAL